MKLEEIQELWSSDCVIDDTELDIESIKIPEDYWRVNVEYSKKIFDICKNVPVIYASSSCAKEWWLSPYGTTKRVMEEVAHEGHVGLRFTNIYGDELSLLGEGYLESYVSLKYLTNRKLREIVVTKTSSWFDDINTENKVEGFNDVVLKSLGGAYEKIVKDYGDNDSNWKWGDAHSLTHKHTLSKVKVLDYLFSLSVGPFKSGGSSLTPNAGGYSINKSFKQTSGASMRRIVDLSDMNSTKMILPTGQSGNVKSPHYKDQAPLYHKGKYRTTWFDEEYVKSEKMFRRLVLRPR